MKKVSLFIKKISMKEKKLIFESDIKEIYSLLNENAFEDIWLTIKEKINDSIGNVRTKEDAVAYITNLYNKIKNLPAETKSKILNYTIFIIFSTLGIKSIYNILPTEIQKATKEVEVKDINDDFKDTHNQRTKDVSNDFKTTKQKSNTRTPINIKTARVSKELIDFLKYEEGSIRHKRKPVLKAYKIGDKKITVGWGHAEDENNSQFKVGQRITVETAKELLRKDIKDAENGIKKFLQEWKRDGIKVKIYQNMFDALVSLAFNMGVQNVRDSDFIQLVKKNKLKAAQQRILTTNVTYPGHETRRQKESEMFGRDLVHANPTKIIREFIRKQISEILSA